MNLANLGLLVGSLLLLTAGAELLVRGSVALARRFGLSSFVIGLTIVGFGTSTPELVTSLSAASHGQDDIAVGNVVGSNIFNTAVILGLAALICPIPVRLRAVRSEVWATIAAAAAPFVALAAGGRVTRVAGIAFLGVLVLQLGVSFRAGRGEGRDMVGELDGVGAPIKIERHRLAFPLALVAVGLTLLVFGAGMLVDSASSIARALGVSELAIALTIVAGGTSAPELVTSVVAAIRKEPEIAVGNVLGSNIFNIFGILGLTSAIHPQTVSPQIVALDAPVMLALSLALLPIVGSGARVSRIEGLALLCAYLTYLWVLFVHAPRWFGG